MTQSGPGPSYDWFILEQVKFYDKLMSTLAFSCLLVSLVYVAKALKRKTAL